MINSVSSQEALIPEQSPSTKSPDETGASTGVVSSLDPNDSVTTPGDADANSPDMIPARMLNEFTYCPRLGFLEWVDGEWSANLETMEGAFGHRRVDMAPKRAKRKPASANPSHADGDSDSSEKPCVTQLNASAAATGQRDADAESIHARSIMLSAPGEGLLARLDLLELEGTTATPVDYKRGKAPTIPEGAYEPERVQLCAQGLILRENGFQCHRGVLYFIGSRKRVTIEFTEELIERTRQLRREFLRTAAAGILPPPLIDSPKCPRCSLVGICLPDEINLLQHDQTIEPADDVPDSIDRSQSTTTEPMPRGIQPVVRKLFPAADDALPLYIQTQGAMLGKSGDRLTIKAKDEVLAERRLMDVSQVSLFGSVIVSAQALRELTVRGIPVCHFTYGGWFHGMTTGLVHKNVQLRIRQFEIAADPQRSLQIARWLISGKVRNCRTLLRRHLQCGPGGPEEMTHDECQTMNELQANSSALTAPAENPALNTGNLPIADTQAPRTSETSPDRRRLLDALAEYRRRAERATSAETLLGLEGMAAKIYFQHYFELLNQRHEFSVSDRNRRPPRDPVNAVLSFVYSLLVKELTVVLQAVGFDPMLGFFHRPRYGRPGLALDVAEEYRPLIGDSVTMMVFNNGELDASSFLERAGAVTLTEAGRRSLIAAFERRLQQEVTHPTFGYRISYRRVLEVQARLLSRFVTGELKEYIPFCTR